MQPASPSPRRTKLMMTGDKRCANGLVLTPGSDRVLPLRSVRDYKCALLPINVSLTNPRHGSSEHHSVTLRIGCQAWSKSVVSIGWGCETRVVAVALDGSLPDSESNGVAGQATPGRLANRSWRYFGPRSEFTNIYSALSVVSSEKLPAEPIAGTDSDSFPWRQTADSDVAAHLDPRTVKESFAQVMSAGPPAMEYFYARLFAANPTIRGLFPTSMTAQREHMFAALAEVIWSLDNQPGCAEILCQLGRDHRRFGVTERHHGAFFTALRDTARHYIGSAWTQHTRKAWQAALDYISATMRAAAAKDAETSPAWWIAEITSHELRSPGVAVLRLQPGEPLPYQAGQYVQVQVTRWPRTWRPYSIANAPRPGGQIELHVRAVPGGLVSNTLVHHCVTGDCVVLGPASGEMTLAETDRDLLCIAGGTGLAPIKAIVEQALAKPAASRPRKITLFVGARQHFDLYDLEDLQLLESACPALRVIPVLSDEPGYSGLTGLLPDVVSGAGLFENTEAYVCGPPAMVSLTTALLAGSIPAAQIHHDPLPPPVSKGPTVKTAVTVVKASRKAKPAGTPRKT